jgi:hypothetical protein
MIGHAQLTHVDVRVVSYEKSGAITGPRRLETGLGLEPAALSRFARWMRRASRDRHGT